MRSSRLVGALAAVAVVAASFAGWRLVASPRVARARAAVITHAAPSPSAALQRSLQRVLEGFPLARTRAPGPRTLTYIVPRALPAPPSSGGSACYVVAGRCSETPCVEFAHAAGSAPTAAPGPVVLRLGTTATRNAPIPRRQTRCQGRLGAPKILRVSGP